MVATVTVMQVRLHPPSPVEIGAVGGVGGEEEEQKEVIQNCKRTSRTIKIWEANMLSCNAGFGYEGTRCCYIDTLPKAAYQGRRADPPLGRGEERRERRRGEEENGRGGERRGG